METHWRQHTHRARPIYTALGRYHSTTFIVGEKNRQLSENSLFWQQPVGVGVGMMLDHSLNAPLQRSQIRVYVSTMIAIYLLAHGS